MASNKKLEAVRDLLLPAALMRGADVSIDWDHRALLIVKGDLGFGITQVRIDDNLYLEGFIETLDNLVKASN